MYIKINTLEKDILREIFNVGVSKAADAFSVLLNNKSGIILTVPDIKIIGPSELAAELQHYDEAVLAVRSRLEGSLEGISVLLFFDKQIEWIIQHCISERTLHHEQISKLRISVLLEISNILTGAILTQFSDLLSLDVHGMPPECMVISENRGVEGIICDLPPCQPIVLSVKTDFLEREMVIELPLLMVLEITSLSEILNTIRQKGIYENNLLKKPGKKP